MGALAVGGVAASRGYSSAPRPRFPHVDEVVGGFDFVNVEIGRAEEPNAGSDMVSTLLTTEGRMDTVDGRLGRSFTIWMKRLFICALGMNSSFDLPKRKPQVGATMSLCSWCFGQVYSRTFKLNTLTCDARRSCS